MKIELRYMRRREITIAKNNTENVSTVTSQWTKRYEARKTVTIKYNIAST